MKYQSVPLVCLSLIFAPLYAEPLLAQCVMSHVGVQVNISKTPATQTSNVEMQSPESCTGNTSSSTAVQVNTLERRVIQNQRVRQEITNGRSNTNGVSGPTIQNSVVVPVNVRTPKNFNR